MPRTDPFASLWADPSTFGSVLLIATIDRIGPEAFAGSFDGQEVYENGYDPLTLLSLIEDQVGSIKSQQFDRMVAAWVIARDERFFTNAADFADWSNALTGHGYDPSETEPIDIEDCAWAVTEAHLLVPNARQYSQEVRIYIREVAAASSLHALPAVLAAVAPSQVSWPVAIRSQVPPDEADAAIQEQRARQSSLNAAIRRDLYDFTQQLRRLSLRHGSADKLVAHLMQSLSV
jgi:hypothetical protein